MNLVPVPKIQVPLLAAEGTDTVARAGGKIQGPPLWKVCSCLSVKTQRMDRKGSGHQKQPP